MNATRPDRPARRPTAGDGFVIVDKPGGWTSHDVVGRMRRLAGTRKVGHGGTLDPMATGVLVVAVGKATKLLTYVTGADKSYDATIRLGVGTTTDDAEGEVSQVSPVVLDETSGTGAATEGTVHLTHAALTDAIAALTGDIMQVPTAVSAIKVDGQRAYARVRAGQEVELQARPVTVSDFTVTALRAAVSDDLPVLDLDVSVTVSSGTYVRALARDLGAALGTAGHLTALRRTRVGGYTLDAAHTLEALEAQADQANASGHGLPTIPIADAAATYLPTRTISDADARALSYGQWITPTVAAPTQPVAALTPDGTLVALLENTRRGGQPYAKPVLVIAAA